MLMILLLTVLTAAGSGNATSAYRLPAGVSRADYRANTIILRVKPDYRSLCTENDIKAPAFLKITGHFGQYRVKKIFPRHLPPSTTFNERGQPLADLSLIYQLEYSADLDLVKTINSILSTGLFLYAEPKFLPGTQYNPNDPSTSLQYFLTNINAYAAWDIHKGDSSTVIGITDTGTDINHPDLQPNIKYNYADPIDGTDNDNDGYVDNFRGWDLGENDNSPQVNADPHGSHVSGCASAVTDNGSGVASPGFYCRFLPVKIADAGGSLTEAYEGIVYAADHGCQIINCSWGGEGGGTFGQNIIDYATFNKNSLVIAAAGNNSTNRLFYPAAYENVICIASTNQSDNKSSFSNYGTYVDVCAPGSGIFSAQFDDSYASQSGTSMASPVAAGCAAIIKSYYPALNALQVGEKLRVTADNIYGASGNSAYIDQLGKGRIDLYNALTATGPAIRMKNIVIGDGNDNILVIGDTIRISGDLFNYLDPTANLVASIANSSSYVTILDSTVSAGIVGTMASYNSGPDPFLIRINPGTPQNTPINFKLRFRDGAYDDFQMLTVTVNVDYINITINDVFTTNTSKGRICYNEPGQMAGLGFDYNDEGSLSYETGFMVGISGNVADNVRGSTAGGTDEDFEPLVTIQKNEPGVWSDFDTYGSFTDATNANVSMDLRMDYKTWSWTVMPFSRFHIFEYTIRNTGTQSRNNLYAGIFSDWDIQTYANNKADEDASLRMGYVYCTDPGGYYAGIKVLTTGGFRHYAIDNITGGGGGVDASNGISTAEKYTTLSTNRPAAGGTGTGNDVIDVVSTGPFNLAPGDSVTVAFALIAGDDLGDLQSGAVQAQVKYSLTTGVANDNPASMTIGPAYPNPSSGMISIPFHHTHDADVILQISDATGRLVFERVLRVVQNGFHELKMDLSALTPGFYQYRLAGATGSAEGKLIRH